MGLPSCCCLELLLVADLVMLCEVSEYPPGRLVVSLMRARQSEPSLISSNVEMDRDVVIELVDGTIP